MNKIYLVLIDLKDSVFSMCFFVLSDIHRSSNMSFFFFLLRAWLRTIHSLYIRPFCLLFFFFSGFFFLLYSLCFFCYYIFLYFYRQPFSQQVSLSVRREKKKISFYSLTPPSFLRQKSRKGKKDEESNKQNTLLLQLTIYRLVYKLTCMCNCLSNSAFMKK